MKKLGSLVVLLFTVLVLVPTALAGDCTKRDSVEWHATIKSAVNVRSDCPTGDVVGTVSAGEVVRVLEVDRYGEFYLVETSVGRGFLFSSFLDVTRSPQPGLEREYEDSIFRDLDPQHRYYEQIEDVADRGIVGGTPEGRILADDPVRRAELAKILVEATTDDETIERAVLARETYSDVEDSAWYLRYLQIAREKGIMSGDSTVKRTVRPGDSANGAEVAKMIAIAFDLDVPVQTPDQEWYKPYMRYFIQMGILPFEDPAHTVTRGEMMYIVSKVLENQDF